MKYKIAQPQYIYELGQRQNQEDYLLPQGNKLTTGTRIFILCDGMGGHDKGEVASETVCSRMLEWFNNNYSTDEPLTATQFNQALDYAYDGLDERDDINVTKKMGTTMTFVALHAGGVTIAHIGDSRIYQIRPATREVLYKSRDHSLVNDLIRLGEMTEEEARTSKQRNIITRAMQPHQERRSRADIDLVTDVKPGDYFYLCSDGMLEIMEDDELVSILASAAMSDEVKRNYLIEKTINNRDNHTAFLIRVLEVEGDAANNDDAVEIEPLAMPDNDFDNEDIVGDNTVEPQKASVPSSNTPANTPQENEEEEQTAVSLPPKKTTTQAPVKEESKKAPQPSKPTPRESQITTPKVAAPTQAPRRKIPALTIFAIIIVLVAAATACYYAYQLLNKPNIEAPVDPEPPKPQPLMQEPARPKTTEPQKTEPKKIEPKKEPVTTPLDKQQDEEKTDTVTNQNLIPEPEQKKEA